MVGRTFFVAAGMAALAPTSVFCARSDASYEIAEASSHKADHNSHLLKYAAQGSDLETFIKNAELNHERRHATMTAAAGLLEVNSSETSDTPRKGSDSPLEAYAPGFWGDRLAATGKYVNGGAYGKVYVTTVKCGAEPYPVAIKIQENTKDAFAEAKLMKELNHRHIVKAFAYATYDRQISIMMESAAGGSFEEMPRNEVDMARLVYESLSGLAYMHSRGYVHRDLKPDNVLLSNKCTPSTPCFAKNADVGLACHLNSCSGVAGTPLYIAPELIKRNRIQPSNDMWSMGVMIHQIVFGRLPSFLNTPGSLERLMQVIGNLASGSHCDRCGRSSARDQLLNGLLEGSSNRRINAVQAKELAAQWFREARGRGIPEAVIAEIPPCWEVCKAARCSRDGLDCRTEVGHSTATCTRPRGQRPSDSEKKAHSGLRTFRIRTGFRSVGMNVLDNGEVNTVDTKRAAYKAGLREGDIIVDLQNRPWADMSVTARRNIFSRYEDILVQVRRS